jgi:hypothetical protein
MRKGALVLNLFFVFCMLLNEFSLAGVKIHGAPAAS